MIATREAHRPSTEDYDAFYETYVSKVPDGDVVGFLRAQMGAALELYRGIPEEKGDFRYAPEKWSTKELIAHVTDAEWVFTYRALRFARGDETPLIGMDQDVFVRGSKLGDRDLAGVVDEFEAVRAANLLLFESFDEEVMCRRGSASGCRFTVRSMLFVIAGHMQHHLGVLRERYL
jgi:hypothetical protein